MPYIQGIKSASGCVFCDEVLAEGHESELLLHRGRSAFVVLNLYPYTTGHLMVVPYRHVGRLQDLEPGEIEECADLVASASGHRPARSARPD
jgi:ATP adenylyltransferase